MCPDRTHYIDAPSRSRITPESCCDTMPELPTLPFFPGFSRFLIHLPPPSRFVISPGYLPYFLMSKLILFIIKSKCVSNVLKLPDHVSNASMRGNASVSQSNAFAANTTAQAVANQITSMVTSQERRAKKKTWRSKLRKWSYKNGRSGCTIEED